MGSACKMSVEGDRTVAPLAGDWRLAGAAGPCPAASGPALPQVMQQRPLTRYRLQRIVSVREEEMASQEPPPSLRALEEYGEGTAGQLLMLQVCAPGGCLYGRRGGGKKFTAAVAAAAVPVAAEPNNCSPARSSAAASCG